MASICSAIITNNAQAAGMCVLCSSGDRWNLSKKTNVYCFIMMYVKVVWSELNAMLKADIRV